MIDWDRLIIGFRSSIFIDWSFRDKHYTKGRKCSGEFVRTTFFLIRDRLIYSYLNTLFSESKSGFFLFFFFFFCFSKKLVGRWGAKHFIGMAFRTHCDKDQLFSAAVWETISVELDRVLFYSGSREVGLRSTMGKILRSIHQAEEIWSSGRTSVCPSAQALEEGEGSVHTPQTWPSQVALV